MFFVFVFQGNPCMPCIQQRETATRPWIQTIRLWGRSANTTGTKASSETVSADNVNPDETWQAHDHNIFSLLSVLSPLPHLAWTACTVKSSAKAPTLQQSASPRVLLLWLQDETGARTKTFKVIQILSEEEDFFWMELNISKLSFNMNCFPRPGWSVSARGDVVGSIHPSHQWVQIQHHRSFALHTSTTDNCILQWVGAGPGLIYWSIVKGHHPFSLLHLLHACCNCWLV